MAKYTCPLCNGYAHTSGNIPNETEWLIVSDVEFDKEPDMMNHDELYEKMTHAFKCTSCDAVAVFLHGYSEDPIWYNPYKASS